MTINSTAPIRGASAALLGILVAASAVATPVVPMAIAYVQGAYQTPQTPVSSTVITYSAAQTAGDLNVVIIGWGNSTSSVSSLTDSAGNSYARAYGPTSTAGHATQVIYYAQNIKAAAAGNQVTVKFNAATPYPDARISEYRGIATSGALDTGIGAAASTGTTFNSGSLNTSQPNELLMGANYIGTGTPIISSGFSERTITSPDNDLVENRVATTAGSYNANSGQTPSGFWVMQMVAFRGAGSGSSSSSSSGSSTSSSSSSSSGSSSGSSGSSSSGGSSSTGSSSSGTISSGSSSGSSPGAVPIAYVQGAYQTPQTPVSSTVITYSAAQTAGDLNVVIVGWGKSTSSVSSLTDSAGNSYARAYGPTSTAGHATQVIYYAQNIKAAAAGNQVTVKFNAATPYPDARISEYRGIATSGALDTGIGAAASTGTTFNSGSLNTSQPNELLMGANYIGTGTPIISSGFTQRTITSPDNDLVENRIATTAGSYNANSGQTPSSFWVMQMVAFRGAGSGSSSSSSSGSSTSSSSSSSSGGSSGSSGSSSSGGSSSTGGSSSGTITLGGPSSSGSSSSSSSSSGSNPNASAAALLKYVTDLSAAGTKHILIGQHTNYWSGNPMDQTQSLISSTGKTPAILGTTIGCIGSVEDGVTLSNQWLAKGGIVMVNLWATDPVTGLDDNDRNVDFGQMSTPGTALYNTWMAYLDTIAAKLKAINGPVLFRPFVELNGNWSWFGGKDPAQFIKVYQQMHDYLVNTKGVNNLVWVYSLNDGNGNYTAYYPGADYIDIVGMDAYPAQDYTKGMYNAALTLNKPMIFAEVGVISPSPSPANFTGNNETMLQLIQADFPAVVAVVIWSQGWSLATQNGASAVMNDQEVITLADL